MSASAIKLDAQSFNLFQKELHRRSGKINKETNEKTGKIEDQVKVSEGVHSIFQHRFKKISWYTPIKERLNVIETAEGAIYTANNTYDHLFKVFMDLTLPALRIKADKQGQYRMAWTHNIGINIAKNAKLMADDIDICSFDSISHDILAQYGYHVKPGFKKHHLISVGSVPKLEQWTSFLPAHQLNVLQPFPYSKSSHLALPLLKSSLMQFKHIYKLRRNIMDLLRMQKYDQKLQTWIDIKPNYTVLDGIKDKDAVLKLPELWGRYGQITDEERSWFRDCEINHEYYYEDIIVCDERDRKRYGECVEIALKSATPVKAIFWVSENIDASQYNNYSNYTTDSENVYSGWNPNKNFKIDYATSTRIEEMSIDHAEREEAWEFPRAPWEAGYNAITFCNNPFSNDGEASVDLQNNGARLIVTLGNTDPSLIMPENYVDKIIDDEVEKDSDDEVEPVTDSENKSGKARPIVKSNKFLLKCRLLVYKKLSYRFDPKKSVYTFKVDTFDNKQVWYDDEIKKLNEAKN